MVDGTTSPRLQRLNAALDFVTKHFAILSVAMAIFGATAAVIFIAAYLTVFDWRAIWIIEYSDVLKIGLLIIALFSGFSYYIWSGASSAIELATEHDRSWLWVHLFGFSLWCLSLGSFLYLDYHSPHPLYALHLGLHFSLLAIISLGLVATSLVREFPNLKPKQFAWVGFVIVANVSVFGRTFGYYTRDTDGFQYNVSLRDKELSGVGLVMLTSHHVVLYTKDQTVIIVPASEVTRLEEKELNRGGIEPLTTPGKSPN
jgi:hypothetical protein